MMMVDVWSKDKEINGNLLENSNSSCLEKDALLKKLQRQ